MEPLNLKRQARRLFLELVELPEAERPAALDRACGIDDAFRAEVEALLHAERSAGGFLSSPTGPRDPVAPAVPPVGAEAAGMQIGHYKLLEKIGEGGMGTIWMAEQREPVKRRVALKIIKLGMDTKQVIARFEAERQALALMDHPHIAKVFDAGSTDTGRPYFVMEYIRGVPILEYCDTHRLDTRARLELFTGVCHAIQHAHQKGIIHRDIKPSNVLVTLHDVVPVPKVIDFGIAKATNSELTTRTLFTEHRQFIGTPNYMSPEQAEMSGLDIDTRSDIYSLGVLLYELLTGTTPFDTKALLESGFDEMLRAIREDEPHKPSTRISTLGATGTRTAQQRQVDSRRLSLLLRGDLDWIVMKCLEKDRTRRYETANGLAADVRRHLQDEPVTAGAPSAAYMLRKFVKRNRVKVVAASAVLTALLAAIVGTSWGLVESGRARSAKALRQIEDQQRISAENARLERNAEAVKALASECEAALRAGDAGKARVTLDAARKRSGEGGAEGEAERITRLAADLDLTVELDAIDQFLWTWSGGNFANPADGEARTRAVLKRFGVDPESVSVAEAAERVEASALRERIVSALDWLLARKSSDALRDLLQQVDADPFRDAFRDAEVARDGAKIVELAGQPAVPEQPSGFVAVMGRIKAIALARRQELLRLAVVRRPSDIVLLMSLQGSYPDTKEGAGERIRWLQAAVAADPQNFAAFTNLGVTLVNAGRFEEAGACARKAIELDPKNALARANLSVVYEHENKLDEALACVRTAVELDPKAAEPYFNMAILLEKQGKTDEAIASFRKSVELDPSNAQVHGSLAETLWKTGQLEEAIASFRKATEVAPKWTMAFKRLAESLASVGRADEAIESFRKAAALEPTAPYYPSCVGDLLRRRGQLDEAIACYRKAVELDPKYDAWGGLGTALKNKGQVDEAIPCLRKSMELRPDYAPTLEILSGCLLMKGQTDEALTLARKSVEIAPRYAGAQVALGCALAAMGREDGAIPCFQKAVEFDPKDANAHHNLGASFVHTGRLVEALPEYRKAAELVPQQAQWQLDLALVLQSLNRHDEAMDHFRASVELDPGLAIAQYNLGWYLQEKHRFDEAIECFRKTIELDPNHPEAHCNLAMCLQNIGRLAEALPYMRRGHELGSRRPDWAYPSAEWVRTAETRAALEAKLPALLDGKVPFKDNEERLECATMCGVKKLYCAATRLMSDAFAADPHLGDDPSAGHRYDAAWSAALASAGRGEDSAQLDDGERSRLRKLAIDWMRADLELLAKKLEAGRPEERKAVQDALRGWQEDADLACVRDPAELAKLPAEDRSAFEQVWAEVATLLNR